MAKKQEAQTPEEEAQAAPDAGTTDADEPAKRAAREQDKSLRAEKDEATGEVRVSIEAPIPVNPSSTYPGRNTDLAEHDMRIPTELDLARRAKFAKSQIPARVYAAGMVNENGEITVQVEEAPTTPKG